MATSWRIVNKNGEIEGVSFPDRHFPPKTLEEGTMLSFVTWLRFSTSAPRDVENFRATVKGGVVFIKLEASTAKGNQWCYSLNGQGTDIQALVQAERTLYEMVTGNKIEDLHAFPLTLPDISGMWNRAAWLIRWIAKGKPLTA